MNALVDGARGLLLASHNDTLLKRVCTLGLVMHQGKCAYFGPIDDALDQYHAQIAPKPAVKPVLATVNGTSPALVQQLRLKAFLQAATASAHRKLSSSSASLANWKE